MITPKKAIELLGGFLTDILQLLTKFFVDWNLDIKTFFYTLNKLKKEEILGLMDETYEIVIKKGSFFIFSKFFFDRPGLFVWDTLESRIGCVYLNPTGYRNINDIKSIVDLDHDMKDSEIIEMLGGEEEVRNNAVTMDQIEQLIRNQWGGTSGTLLNNGSFNVFYVIGEDSKLFSIHVFRAEGQGAWIVGDSEIEEHGPCSKSSRIFSN